MTKIEIMNRLNGINEQINDLNVRLQEIKPVSPINNQTNYAKSSSLISEQIILIKQRDDLEKDLEKLIKMDNE